MELFHNFSHSSSHVQYGKIECSKGKVRVNSFEDDFEATQSATVLINVSVEDGARQNS